MKRKGASLRVREADGRWTQTVKTADGGGDLLARGEWEDEVAENRPDPQAPHGGPQLPEGLVDKLRPLFVTEVDRRTIEIEPQPGTRIEAAIDSGQIRAIDNGRNERLSELELDLKAGDPAAVLDDLALETARDRAVADRCAQQVRARLPSDRRRIARPSPVHAEALALDAGMLVEQVLQRIGRSCLAHLLKNEPAALDGQPQGVHQMLGPHCAGCARCCRRSRSCCRKRSAARSPTGWRVWRPRSGRRAISTFFPPNCCSCCAANAQMSPVDELSAAAERARADAHSRVAGKILSPRHTEAVLRLLRWFDTSGWRVPSIPETSALTAPIGRIAPDLLDRLAAPRAPAQPAL